MDDMEERALDLVKQYNDQPVVKEATGNIVEEERDRALEDIRNSDDFKESSDELYHKEVREDFRTKGLEIANKELQNDYDQYALTKKKELLNLRVKREKRLIKEQVDAEVQDQKMQNAVRRYGYLTPILDEDGSPKKDEEGNIKVDMTKFTPNKWSNRFKELEFNYRNMSQTARKCIWTTIKTLTIGGLITLGVFLIMKYVVPFVQQLPQI